MKLWISLGLFALATLPVRNAGAADEALKSSVVWIEVDKLVSRQTAGGELRTKIETYVGSGFWAAGTNRIVTCAHVIDGARKVRVKRYGAPRAQKPWSTELGQLALCLSDPGHDLAIIQVPEVGLGLPLTPGPIAASASIRSVGHTDKVPWRLNRGDFTERYKALDIEVPLEGDVLVCDISFGPGSSGGIVVDRENRIIGMIEGGKQGGKFGTRIAIPAATIQSALRSLAADQTCHGDLIKPGAAIVANENTFAGLLRVDGDGPERFPARYWGQAAYGFLMGADRFDDPVPALQLELLRSWTNGRSWLLRAEVAERKIDRIVEGGGQTAADAAEMLRLSLTTGPRLLLKEFGRVTVYSAVATGYVHDRITHDYTFTSTTLFAPQSYERSVSALLGEVSLDANVQIVLNLRLSLSSKFWQGSGGIGNGVTHQIGLRFGVGGVAR